MSLILVCSRCGHLEDTGPRCARCGGLLETHYPNATAAACGGAPGLEGIWRYAPLLPIADPGAAVSLGEGGTPLIRSRRLGLPNLWLKVESANPTGSYKDRIAAVAMSRAREGGRRGWLATSSGNAGAALAAYGARAGLAGTVVVPASAPEGKLSQIRAFGPRMVTVQRFGTAADVDAGVFAALRAAATAQGLALSITAHAFDPWALDGAKTIAFEIAESLATRGRAAEHVYAPVGGGGLAAAMARGFREWAGLGGIGAEPRLHVVQAEGCAPVVGAWRRGTDVEPVAEVTTAISGVQLADPPDGALVLAAIRRTDGGACSLPDADVYAVQARLAREEGLFVEPAGALAVAGALADADAGRLDRDAVTVCVLTGSGSKDTGALARWPGWRAQLPMVPLGELSGWIAGGTA